MAPDPSGRNSWQRADCPTAVGAAERFNKSVGKVTIRVKKKKNGYIVNRLQAALWREAISIVVEGVASVEDVDKVVLAGPGMRWAEMAPTMLFNLGAGEGAAQSFRDHFSNTSNGWRDNLGQVHLTEDVARTLIDGISEEARDQNPAELLAQRDALIAAMQRATTGVR